MFFFLSVIEQNVLATDPTTLLYAIPVCFEDNMDALASKEQNAEQVAYNTDDCEWKISSAYSLAQPDEKVIEGISREYRNERENTSSMRTTSCEMEEENYRLFFGSQNKEGFDKIPDSFGEANKIKKGNKLKKRSRIIRGSAITRKIYSPEQCKQSDGVLDNIIPSFVRQRERIKNSKQEKRNLTTHSSRAPNTKKWSMSKHQSMSMIKDVREKGVKPVRKGLCRYDFRTFRRKSRLKVKRPVRHRYSSPPRATVAETQNETCQNKDKTAESNDVQSENAENQNEEHKNCSTEISTKHPVHVLVDGGERGMCVYCYENPETKGKIDLVRNKCKVCNVYLCKSFFIAGGRSCFDRYHQENAKHITKTLLDESAGTEEMMAIHYPVRVNIKEDYKKKKVCEICFAKRSQEGGGEYSVSSIHKCSVCSVGLCTGKKDCFKIYHNLLFGVNNGN